MKIGITADLHLKSLTESPERYHALEDLLKSLRAGSIDTLIIAGDLFNQNENNYSDFENCAKKYTDIKIIIIPGNHDSNLDAKYFSSENITVINQISYIQIDRLNILFVPYDNFRTMDEVINEFRITHPDQMKGDGNLVFVGHGDYITGKKEINPYEPGIYMPLSARVINKYNPSRVFLGHIHKPGEYGKITYPGSPCGLDITETGKRRFIVFDSESNSIESVSINTEVYFFNESFLILPFEDEESYIEKKVKEIADSWDIEIKNRSLVKLRIKARGYTKNKLLFSESLKNNFTNLGISGKNIEILLDDVNVHDDYQKNLILNGIQRKISGLDFSSILISEEDIMNQAMEYIFKGNG